MDIHAPDKPVHSWREFGVHIAIVTCGILIALALEGVREAWHDRHLVHETRASVVYEMGWNRKHGEQEMARVQANLAALKKLAAAFPALAKQHPEQLAPAVSAIRSPGYFFSANSWQTALSTGAPAHMSTEEASSYASVALVIGVYTGLQKDAYTAEGNAQAFFATHPTMTPADAERGAELLLLWERAEESLVYVEPEMQEQIVKALEIAGK